ncbi:hypothetical protein QUG71_21705 [Enterobacter asburiae]|uniref:hypothetical protein n=1 Tax=Enterobacter cloacae complex TaxID=354276 RepID=UPI00063C9184|nr:MULTISPECIES: hypothetical protein [Enterobacter cloacae complex]DAE47029.1 MAG TPA: hypothetical protein [Caudoviricetes sp.]ELE6992443.1 hypothetical protein [Enterobacter kobei]KLG13566.1 hypothetical protein YA47_03945 [Enterobacter asburiae]MCZ9449084.1 hypothetical protein [Enterobacter asburiae]MDK9982776.1 hypothetical protein [Enterobacter asburiae]
MSDQAPIITHEPVSIVLTIENGKVIHTRPVHNGEVTASLETFLWMAEQAGYTITPPAGEKDNGPDRDTNS